jgi:hypothetical protein
MKKQDNSAKDAKEHRKKLPSGTTQQPKEKKKLPEPRGRVVRKKSNSKGKYIPVGKVVRKT